jgi:ornithine cyclodeaminase/alanine dehydrogenase-like protein (mu-crystallin family)
MLSVEPHGGFFGAMPAAGEVGMGIKLVTFYPGNAERSLHTHLAMILLFDPETGEPLAVMDGRLITEMRTAAASAVATRALAAPDATVLAVLGSGVQARVHVEALRLVRDFREVRIWGPHARARRDARGGVGRRGRALSRRGGAGRRCGGHRHLGDGTRAAGRLAGAADACECGGLAGPYRSGAGRGRYAGHLRGGGLARSGAAGVGDVLLSGGMAVEDVAAARLVYDRLQART